ncbi:unnamed protein product [Urochloa decumbens]|uniref:Non-haem dioxygenase N-terminal domain-containing protein n=1 Tax=Urochloa decumbens TaxID=240449 RepID=A0ABC9BVI8_9POAL
MEIANAKVDLRGVVPGTPGWEAARAAVTASMVAHGFVIVAHGDALGPDLQHAVFGRAMPELFALPPETKQRAAPDDAGVLTTGYVGHVHGMAWESLRVEDPTDAAGFRRVADLLWPEGNAGFCETMVSFAKTVLKLQETVEVLTLEGLGVRAESVRAHLGTLGYGVRLAHYGAPLDTETCVSLPAHCDNSMDTAVVQHEVEGLEVHLGDGRDPGRPLGRRPSRARHLRHRRRRPAQGRLERARAGVPPPRADAEPPRAVHSAVHPWAEGRRRGARAGRPRRRGAPTGVQPAEARGVLQVGLLGGRAQIRGSTQGVLRSGQGRWSRSLILTSHSRAHVSLSTAHFQACLVTFPSKIKERAVHVAP